MKSRPLSVAIIGWVLLVFGLYLLIVNLLTFNNSEIKDMMANSPMPMALQYALMYCGTLILIISGIGILKGKNWARWLYTIWGIIGIIISVVTTPINMMMIPGVLFFLIIVFFLFRRKANEFFSKN